MSLPLIPTISDYQYQMANQVDVCDVNANCWHVLLYIPPQALFSYNAMISFMMARGRMSPKVMSNNKDSKSNRKHISNISDPLQQSVCSQRERERERGVLWVDKPNVCLHVCVNLQIERRETGVLFISCLMWCLTVDLVSYHLKRRTKFFFYLPFLYLNQLFSQHLFRHICMTNSNEVNHTVNTQSPSSAYVKTAHWFPTSQKSTIAAAVTH